MKVDTLLQTILAAVAVSKALSYDVSERATTSDESQARRLSTFSTVKLYPGTSRSLFSAGKQSTHASEADGEPQEDEATEEETPSKGSKKHLKKSGGEVDEGGEDEDEKSTIKPKKRKAAAEPQEDEATEDETPPKRSKKHSKKSGEEVEEGDEDEDEKSTIKPKKRKAAAEPQEDEATEDETPPNGSKKHLKTSGEEVEEGDEDEDEKSTIKPKKRKAAAESQEDEATEDETPPNGSKKHLKKSGEEVEGDEVEDEKPTSKSKKQPKAAEEGDGEDPAEGSESSEIKGRSHKNESDESALEGGDPDVGLPTKRKNFHSRKENGNEETSDEASGEEYPNPQRSKRLNNGRYYFEVDPESASKYAENRGFGRADGVHDGYGHRPYDEFRRDHYYPARKRVNPYPQREADDYHDYPRYPMYGAPSSYDLPLSRQSQSYGNELSYPNDYYGAAWRNPEYATMMHDFPRHPREYNGEDGSFDPYPHDQASGYDAYPKRGPYGGRSGGYDPRIDSGPPRPCDDCSIYPNDPLEGRSQPFNGANGRPAPYKYQSRNPPMVEQTQVDQSGIEVPIVEDSFNQLAPASSPKLSAPPSTLSDQNEGSSTSNVVSPPKTSFFSDKATEPKSSMMASAAEPSTATDLSPASSEKDAAKPISPSEPTGGTESLANTAKTPSKDQSNIASVPPLNNAKDVSKSSVSVAA